MPSVRQCEMSGRGASHRDRFFDLLILSAVCPEVWSWWKSNHFNHKEHKDHKERRRKVELEMMQTRHRLRPVKDPSDAPTQNLDSVQLIFFFFTFVIFVVQKLPIPVTSVNDSSNAILQHGYAKIDDQTVSQPG